MKEEGVAVETEVSVVKAQEEENTIKTMMMIMVLKMSGPKKKEMNMVITRMRDPEIEDKDTKIMMIPMMRGLKMKGSHESKSRTTIGKAQTMRIMMKPRTLVIKNQKNLGRKKWRSRKKILNKLVWMRKT